jgi:hypothetical protein
MTIEVGPSARDGQISMGGPTIGHGLKIVLRGWAIFAGLFLTVDRVVVARVGFWRRRSAIGRSSRDFIVLWWWWYF